MNPDFLRTPSAPTAAEDGALQRSLGTAEAAAWEALNATLWQAARQIGSPIAVLITATGRPLELTAMYCVEGELQLSLPDRENRCIPNVWTVSGHEMRERALPGKIGFMPRQLMERNAYPTAQALNFYAAYDYSGWMDWPLFDEGAVVGKIALMRTSPHPPLPGELEAREKLLTSVKVAWRWWRQVSRFRELAAAC